MRFVLFAAAIALVGCSSKATGPDATLAAVAGEPAELAGITAAHNVVRAAVGVGPMTWNDDLAALAAGFITNCQFAHTSQQQRSNVAGFAYVGENLFEEEGALPTGPEVSDAWASEKSNYDYSSNTCITTAMECGHYTQQVWATSVDLGCAIQACPNNTYIVECEYGPGGNYVGEKPY